MAQQLVDFDAAKLACLELREHLSGQRRLAAATIEGHKELIRRASKASLYFFAKEVLGYDKMTRTHKKWSEDLEAKWLRVRRLMRLKPRGTYKTTLYGISFLLWVWCCWSKEVRFVYTSANEKLLEEVSAEFERHIGGDDDSVVGIVFGLRRDPNNAVKNTKDVFNVEGGSHQSGKGFDLTLCTAGSSTNGLHPHFIIIDDPMDQRDRSSQATRDEKERWYGSLQPLLTPYQLRLDDGSVVELQSIMFIATRWHLRDLVHYVRSKKGVHWDYESESVYLDDGVTPRYPEFLAEPQIAEKRAECSTVEFACWFLNNPLPEGSIVFMESRLHFRRPDQVDIRKGSNYCVFDPSMGKDASDFPAVVWVNLLNGHKHFYDAIDTKHELTSLVGLIAAKNFQDRVRVMVFETNGAMTMEKTLRDAHRTAAMLHGGYRIKLEPIHETRSKTERITAMQPLLYGGSYSFPADWEQRFPNMRSQILYFPVAGNDDYPDVVEKGVSYFELNLPDLDRFRALGKA